MEGYLGHWPAREAAVAAAHHPDVQVPPDEGTWFQRTVRQGHHVAGDRMGGCSVLWPPAAPHPSSGPGHLTLQGLLGTGPAPKRCSAVCVCVCVCVRVTSGHADEGRHRLPGDHPLGPRGSSLGSGRGLVLTPKCQEAQVSVGPRGVPLWPDPGFWQRGFVHSWRSFPASVPPAEVNEFISGDARRPAAPRSRH